MTGIIKKTGIQLGIALGVALVLLSSYIYFIATKLFTNVWMGLFTIFITVIFGIIAILITKKKLGGYITFKEAFSTYFFTIVVGKLISCVFAVIISSFVLTTETRATIKQQMSDFNMKIMKQNETPAEEIAKNNETFKTYDPFAPSEIIAPTIKYLLRDSLIGFLVALIFRNKRSLTV
ncbi:MAG: DUF4199 domain-containing protein [Flavobacterium sp.]|nr:DUF4199 domain-containing protein [Flavobacterium sp.]